MKTSFAHEFFKKVSWSFFGRVFNLLFTFSINVIIVRVTTKVEVGTYFYAMSLVWLLSLIVQGGVNHTLIKTISGNNAKGEGVKNINVISYAFLTATLTTAVLFFMLSIFEQSHWLNALISNDQVKNNMEGLLLWTFLFSVNLNNIDILKANLKIRGASLLNILSPFVIFLILFYLMMAGQSISYHEIINIYCIGYGAHAFINLYFLFQQRLNIKFIDLSQTSNLVTLSAPFLVTNLSLFFILQVDLWVLNYKMNPLVVANYGAAYRLMLLISIPMTIINFVIQPLISDLHSRSNLTKLQSLLQAGALAGFLPGLLIFLVYLVMGEWILEVVFNESFKEAKGLLLILCLGQLSNLFFGAVGYVLMMMGREKKMMYITIFAGALNLLLSLVLIDYYGEYGAAVASLVALSTQSLLMWNVVRKDLELLSQVKLSQLFNLKSVVKELNAE